MGAAGRVRLAELVASLSLATDLGTGQPMEHTLRTSWLSLSTAEALGAGTAELSTVYYVALLRFLGCTADASETAASVGGDEIACSAQRAQRPRVPAPRLGLPTTGGTMVTTTKVRCDTATVNGTELHYELRGDGPTLMFVSGAFGDAGGWEITAAELAETWTVLCYDRRGNSRSPRPAGWSSTSLDEQADDAAALLEALDLAPAAVYGNSLGADIAVNLVLRHPGVVSHVILHEPGLDAALDDPDEALAPFMEVMGPSIEAGDLRGAADALLRPACGDDAYRMIPADRVDRLLGNAETLLEIELAGDASIDRAALARCTVPMTVVQGAASPPFLTTGSRKFAKLLQAQPVTVPGAHVPSSPTRASWRPRSPTSCGRSPADIASRARSMSRRTSTRVRCWR